MLPAAAGEEKGRVRGHLALRPGDAVPRHPLLRSYMSLELSRGRPNPLPYIRRARFTPMSKVRGTRGPLLVEEKCP